MTLTLIFIFEDFEMIVLLILSLVVAGVYWLLDYLEDRNLDYEREQRHRLCQKLVEDYKKSPAYKNHFK
jgi:hypothetical protein